MVLRCPVSPFWQKFLLYFLLVICMMLVLYICWRIMKTRLPRTRRRLPSENNSDEPSAQPQSTGLASAVIRSLPAIRFRKDINEGDGHGSNDCAICLAKFHRGEWVRRLPNCAHVFHVYCIDSWFRTRSTCPLCRTNVLYDFNDSNPSVSMGVVSLGALQREDACWERAPGCGLLQLEFRMGAMSGCPYETESDESSQGLVSPVERPSNYQRRTVEELLKIAHNNNGESCSRDLGSNIEDHICAQRPLA